MPGGGRIYGGSETTSDNNLFWFRADPVVPLPKAFHRAYGHIASAQGRASVAPNGVSAGGMSARPVQLLRNSTNPSFQGPSWRDFSESEKPQPRGQQSD